MASRVSGQGRLVNRATFLKLDCDPMRYYSAAGPWSPPIRVVNITRTMVHLA